MVPDVVSKNDKAVKRPKDDDKITAPTYTRFG